jgi:hypothetical protein
MKLERNEKEAPITFTEYATSPLAVLLSGILAKIDAVKKKYPHEPKLAELSKTEQLVASIETMLKSLHENILPKFDQGKECDPMDIVWMLKEVNSIQDIFVPDNFKITNPMMFELAIEMARLFLLAPITLEQLVPFLNPKALAVNLHNGKAGWAMHLGAKRTIILKEADKTEANKRSYAYKITQYVNSALTEEDALYDFALYYANYFQYVFTLLVGEIKKFSDEQADNSEMQEEISIFLRNELARSALLESYVVEETHEIQSLINALNKNDATKGLDELRGAELVKALNSRIDNLKEQYREISEVENKLLIKKSRLEPVGVGAALSFEELLQRPQHATLKSQLKYDSERGFNTAYAQSPLPDAVLRFVFGEEATEIVLLKKRLIKFNNESIHSLKGGKADNEAQRALLNSNRESAISAWKKTEEDSCASSIKEYVRDLESMQAHLHELNKTIDRLAVVGHNIFALQQALETIAQQSQLVGQLHKGLNSIRGSIHKASELTQKSADLKIDHSLQNSLNELATPALKIMEGLHRQINHAETVLNEKQQLIEHNLAIARVNDDSMHSAEPVKMRKSLMEKILQIGQLNAHKTQITREKEVIQLEIAEQQQRIQEIKATKEAYQMCMDGHAGLYSKHIIAALAIIEPQQLQPLQTVDHLLSKEGNLKQWLQEHIEGKILQASENTYDLLNYDNYQDVIQQLLDVERCLDSNETMTIPFAQIDELVALKPKNPLKTPQGFDRLARLLGFTEAEISEWANYKVRQDSYYLVIQYRPTADEFNTNITHLSERVKSKKAELMSIQGLSKIMAAIAEQDRQKTITQRDLAAENLKFTSATRNLESLCQQLTLKQQEILNCETHIAHSTASLAVFESSIKSLEAILSHRDTIDQYMSLEATFGGENSEALYPTMLTLNNQQLHLEATMTQIEEANAELSDPLTYQPVLQAIRQLLAANNEQIKDALETKFAYLRGEIADLNDEIANFVLNLDNLRPAAEINQEVAALTGRKTVIAEKLSALKKVVTEEDFDSATNYLEILEDELMVALDTTAERIDAAITGVNYSLIQRITQFIGGSTPRYEEISEEYNTAINNAAGDLENFISVTNSLIQRNNALLNDIVAQEAALPNPLHNVNHLDNGEGPSPIDVKIQELNVFKNNIVRLGTLLSRSRENSELRFRTADEYSRKFTMYIDERNIRCKDKDRITRGDKDDRMAYVNRLKDEMAEYARTGDNSKIMNTLQKGLRTKKNGKMRFPGFRLRSLLNKLMVEILNISSVINLEPVAAAVAEVDAGGGAIPHAAENGEPEAVEVVIAPIESPIKIFLRNLCASLVPEQKNFGIGLQNLYENIKEMEAYVSTLPESPGKTEATNFATSLRQELDTFVRAHIDDPDIHSARAEYPDFKTKFIAQLHSKGDVMSTLRSSGEKAGVIIANIIAGVFTLGIALGIKLLVSKVSTGRFALFFDKTTIQQKIESVDNSVVALSAAAA